MEKLFNIIEQNTDTYKQFWIDICNIEGISADKAAVDEVSSFIEKFCCNKGFDVKRFPFEKAGDCLIVEMNADSNEKGFVFLAHMDTVHEKGKFGSPAVTEKDGILYGPGVIDCKGGIAVALLTMQALMEVGYKKHTRLILTSDEEVSGRLSGEKGIEFIKEYSRGFTGAFNCEVGICGAITVGRKGILCQKIDITGKASHSGIAYFEGISAVKEAAYKIIEIENHSTEGGTTYNCGLISGGELANIVPQKCSFLLDTRFATIADMEKAIEFVNSIVHKSFVNGTKSVVTPISKRMPMERTQDNEELFNKIKETCDKYNLEKVEPVVSGGGSDSAYTVMAGVPSVCSVGTIGDYCHTENEYAEIASLARRAKMLGATITEHK